MIGRFGLSGRLWVGTVANLIFIVLSPTLASASELDDLRQAMLEMEARHEADMAALRSRIEELAGQPEESTAERLELAEEEIESLYETQSALAAESDRFTWGGYATLTAENIEDFNSTFLGRTEFFADARLTDRLRLHTQLEIEGGDHADELEVEQAWLEYYASQAFRPTFGVVLAPFNRYNKYHFNPNRDLVSKPLVVQDVMTGIWKSVGMGFSGRQGSVNYELFATNGLGNNYSDTGGSHGSIILDNNNNKAFVGRFGIEPTSNIEIGISGYSGRYDTEDKARMNGLGVDWDFRFGDLEIIGEYARFSFDEGVMVLAGEHAAEEAREQHDEGDGGDHEDEEQEGDHEQEEINGIAALDSSSGFYVQANYHFWPVFLEDSMVKRHFPGSRLTAVVRYGRAKLDDDGDDDNGDGDIADPDNHERRWTFGLNYRPTDSWVYKLEYIKSDTDNEPIQFGNRRGFLFSVSGHF